MISMRRLPRELKQGRERKLDLMTLSSFFMVKLHRRVFFCNHSGRTMLGVTFVNKVIDVNHRENDQHGLARAVLVRAFGLLETIEPRGFGSFLCRLSNH